MHVGVKLLWSPTWSRNWQLDGSCLEENLKKDDAQMEVLGMSTKLGVELERGGTAEWEAAGRTI